jgi:hypothetical protein
MEIPAALHGLETQYENVLSHFNFGKFDPFKQGLVFQNKLKNYFSKEEDQIFNENILFIYFDNSNSNKTLQQIQIFIQLLWKNLC